MTAAAAAAVAVIMAAVMPNDRTRERAEVIAPRIHRARLTELDARTLHDLLRLRIDVFVVEQRCAYPELDGRDAEPDALHLWVEEEGRPVAALRLLREPGGGSRIGRVVTAADRRGRGLAEALLRDALSLAPRPVVLSAQTPLAPWYERHGFTVTGPEADEDGIPHVPMRLG